MRSANSDSQALPRWRLRAVAALLLALLSLLVWRTLSLQVLDNERGHQFLQIEGDNRSIRREVIPAHRGQILDRNGEPLAISTPVVSIYANPAEMDGGRDGWGELARRLDLPYQALADKLSYKGRQFVYLRRHLPPPVAEAVLTLKVRGIYGQREYRRFYPAGEVTAHLLGFTNIDDHGQEGVELAYDSWLSGAPGSKKVLKGLTGKIIREIGDGQPPQPGKDLTLSIDLRLQYLAHRELRAQLAETGAAAGSLVMLDSQTGEVLAMANQPSFNPNNRASMTAANMRNRAIIDLIEPGSTMKPLAMVAALESGRFTPQTQVDTRPGWLRVERKTLKDPVNYGVIDLTRIITKSSQVGLTKVALDIEQQSVWDVFQRFGLSANTDTGFPGETYGMLPQRRRWSDIERANFAFGYGLQVTPLQLARAYAVFANGGRYQPVTLLKRDNREMRGEQVVSRDIAGQLVQMMTTVTGPEGTGKRAHIHAYSVAGKTGTVHQIGASGYDTARYRSIFAGFAPASKPRVVTVVVVEDPKGARYGGGDVAAPVFARVVGNAMRMLNIAPDEASKEKAGSAVAQRPVAAPVAPAPIASVKGGPV